MLFDADKPNWIIEGRDWPNRDCSRFVNAGGLRWHVQIAGEGPDLLLLHGTGAATHSWRGLLPLLARDFRVIAPDLPGHGFTETPPRRQLTLPGMAALVAALMDALGAAPPCLVGHSAGAAIIAGMCLSDALHPHVLISINGALLPFRGRNGPLFSLLAKALALNPLAPRLFAWQAGNRGSIERLMSEIGSSLDPEGLDLYRRLFRRSGHVAAALNMMANWDLDSLTDRLAGRDLPIMLIAAENDGAIPIAESRRLGALLPTSKLLMIENAGHLVHEEMPDRVAAMILSAAVPMS